MNLNRTTFGSKRLATALLCGALATAGLGLGFTGAWAEEGVEPTEQAQQDASQSVVGDVIAKPDAASAFYGALAEIRGQQLPPLDATLTAAAYARADSVVRAGASMRSDGANLASVSAYADGEAVVFGPAAAIGGEGAWAAASALNERASWVLDGSAQVGVAAAAYGDALFYVVVGSVNGSDGSQADFQAVQDGVLGASVESDATAQSLWQIADAGAEGVVDGAMALYAYAEPAPVAPEPEAEPQAAQVQVGDYVGMASEDARAAVESAGLVADVRDAGPAPSAEQQWLVFAQAPEAQALADTGSTVSLDAYGEYVEPLDLADATVAGIIDQSIVSDYATPQEPPFTVIAPDNTMVDSSQYTFYFENNVDPGEATLVVVAAEDSTTVTGQLVKTFEIQAPQVATATVPDVSGRTQGDALNELVNAGIANATFVDGSPAPAPEQVGTVEATSPAAGEQVDAATGTVEVALFTAEAPAEPAADDGQAEDQDQPQDEQSESETDEPAQQDGSSDESAAAETEGADAADGEGQPADSEEQAADATAQLVVDPIPDQVYTGSEIVPPFSASFGDEKVGQENLAISSIENNVEVGVATLTVVGKQGTVYEGLSAEPVTFNIVEPASNTIDISSFNAMVREDAQVKVIGPNEAAVLSVDDIIVSDGSTRLSTDDFVIASYVNNAQPGTATVQIQGVGGYTGIVNATFAVRGAIGQAAVSLPSSQTQNLFYTGSPITPIPSVIFGSTTLNQNSDYTLSYTNNVNAGTASLTVTGIGNYTGESTINFTIQPKSIKSAQISPIAAVDYTGAPITPTINVVDGTSPLQPDVDYSVAFSGNTNAGTAHVIVTGTGNYRDSIDTTFVINKLEMRRVSVVMPNMVYTGSALTPKPVSVTVGAPAASAAANSLVIVRPSVAWAAEASGAGIQLVEGVDYDIVNYSNNVQVGEAKVELRGKGNFTGTKVASFRIVDAGTANPGTTQTLPATGDDTNTPLLIGGIVGGVALVGAGAGLVVHSRRKNRK